MSKKVKVLVSVGLAALLLVVGIAVPIVAQDEATPPLPTVCREGALDRIAEILGISGEDLVDAFQQARAEMREEKFTAALDRAVEKGIITQEEADEIEEWADGRPEATERLHLRFLRTLKRRHCHGAPGSAE